MKLKDTIVIDEMDGYYFAVDAINYDTRENYVMNINDVTKFMMETLRNETSFDELVDIVMNKYGSSKEKAIKDVNYVIDVLKKGLFLDE